MVGVLVWVVGVGTAAKWLWCGPGLPGPEGFPCGILCGGGCLVWMDPQNIVPSPGAKTFILSCVLESWGCGCSFNLHVYKRMKKSEKERERVSLCLLSMINLQDFFVVLRAFYL